MNFIWDSRKAASNLKKHEVSFDEAATVFLGSRRSLAQTPITPKVRPAG